MPSQTTVSIRKWCAGERVTSHLPGQTQTGSQDFRILTDHQNLHSRVHAEPSSGCPANNPGHERNDLGLTATAATHGRRQRPVTTQNTRAIHSNWRNVRSERRTVVRRHRTPTWSSRRNTGAARSPARSCAAARRSCGTSARTSAPSSASSTAKPITSTCSCTTRPGSPCPARSAPSAAATARRAGLSRLDGARYFRHDRQRTVGNG